VSGRACHGEVARSGPSDQRNSVALPVRMPRTFTVSVTWFSGTARRKAAVVNRSGDTRMCVVLLKPKSPANSAQISCAPVSALSSSEVYVAAPGSQAAAARPPTVEAKRICETPVGGTASVTVREATAVPPPCSPNSGEKSTRARTMVAAEVKSSPVAHTRTRTVSPWSAAPASSTMYVVSPGALAGWVVSLS